MSDFDYVTVGHVTVDVIGTDGARRPGGGAFYSALQAARLGLRTLIVTKGVPDELEELLAPYSKELALQIHPAQQTTTLVTAGMGAERKQRVAAWAGAITEPIEVNTSILHLTAVARETPNHWRGSAEFVGITPQGWMRAWDGEGEVTHVPLHPETMPAHFDALVISEVERRWCRRVIASTGAQAQAADAPEQSPADAREPSPAGGAGVIAVTAGSAPTSILLPDGSATEVPVPATAHPRDDLGAGDVFAAAFFIALREGRSPMDAAAFGNAAATVRIANLGPQAVGDRATIDAAPHR
ncbi:MAG TPA: PfkB family carbohydrate kinase [Solirubrobacteraceae bacterium]|nr:PfkB family carbohydrate kinase [Solirubrobacteraceae bacterium]